MPTTLSNRIGRGDARRSATVRAIALAAALTAGVTVGVTAGGVRAAQPSPSPSPSPELRFGGLSAVERDDILRVERYLNGIKTLKSRFVQTAPDGRRAEGTFTLSRPGKMRLVYDPPFKDFVVADGLFIFYWDGEMRQQSSAPLGSSLADLILRENLRLSGEVTVVSAERRGDRLEVTLAESGDPGKGSMTLVFKDGVGGKGALALDSWRVFDATGQVTEVRLINPESGIKLDPDQFVFRAPRDPSQEGGSFSRK